jgi:diguanylate cyclase (GGDEF)-like protein
VLFNVTLYHDSDGEVAGVLLSARDVTERNRLTADLEHQALHDTLTGLPNKALFVNRLEHSLERAGLAGEKIAVLFLDLDRFKVINDSLGHGAGDALLVNAAGRLERCVRYGDTVARIGGDEFVILMEDIVDDSEAERMARKVTKTLRDERFDIEGEEVVVSASVSIAIGGSGETANELLRSADLAMYDAKRGGKDGYQIFSPEMNDQAQVRLKMESDLRRAIERDEMQVHYQPKTDLRSGGIYGFEALVRWESPERSRVSPDEFVPLAEETGLPPENLCLEITETALMEDAEAAMLVLQNLAALGIRLAIDDFGTGYSSFSYLRRFPVHSLKIDRYFIERMEAGTENVAIVETMVTLSKTLGLTVVAEGIETYEQLEILQTLDCDYGQGFYFSRPLESTAADTLLQYILVRGSTLTP